MTEEDVFVAALEKEDGAERTAFLRTACAGNEGLWRRVEALLQSHEGAGPFLATPALEQLAANTPAASAPQLAEADTLRGPRESISAFLQHLEPARRPDSQGRLNHYEILQVVGEGGFGIVLKGFDEKLHRVVAIKVLRPELAVNGVACQRFLREARSAAGIRHENVIHIYAVDEHPLPYLVMEFIDGPTLQQKLERTGPLTAKDILNIGVQIAAGLAAAHQRGLIHRDIKPANILLENGVERVKLSDFGLARAADDASMSQSGLIAGTPQYMSPEQADGRPLDQRSDLFSLGSILYALCTGHPPFRADSTLGVLRRVADETPHPIRDSNSDIPQWLTAVVDRLHAKQPEQRFQSAHDVAELLARYLAELHSHGEVRDPGMATELGSEKTFPPVAAREDRSAPRRRLPMLLTTTLLLLTFAVSIFTYRHWTAPTSVPGESPHGESPHQPLPAQPLPTALQLAERPSLLDQLQGDDDLLPTLVGKPGDAVTKEPVPGLIAVLADRRFLHKNGTTKGFSAGVAGIACSASGKYLASTAGTFDPPAGGFSSWELKLWDVTTGKLLRTFDDRSYTRALAFSPDSERLVTAHQDGTLNIWNVEADNEPRTLTGHHGAVRAVAWSTDGKWLVSGGDDRHTIVWDAATGQSRVTFDKHKSEVLAVAFSPDNARVVSAGGSGEGAIRLLETSTGTEITRLHAGAVVRGVVFSHDGKRLTAVGEEATAHVWDLATGTVAAELKGHSGWVIAVARSPDGKSIATGSTDGSARVWNADTGVESFSCPGHSVLVHCLAFGADGARLFTADTTGRIHVWDLATGNKMPLQQHASAVLSVEVSPDGKLLASSATDRTVCLWDLASGELKHRLRGHSDYVYSATFSPDGQILATSDKEGTIKLWNVPSATEIAILAEGCGPVRHVVFAPDGASLAAACFDGPVKIWHVGTRTLCHDFKPRGKTWCVAFSPDGKTLASAHDGGVRLWELDTGRALGSTSGQEGAVRWVAFHPDGRTLCSATYVGDIRLWDAGTLAEKRALARQSGGSLAGAWRADGRLLVTSSARNGTFRLADFSSDTPRYKTMTVLGEGAHYLHSIALTPEGRHVITANPQGTIAILRLAELGQVFQPSE